MPEVEVKPLEYNPACGMRGCVQHALYMLRQVPRCRASGTALIHCLICLRSQTPPRHFLRCRTTPAARPHPPTAVGKDAEFQHVRMRVTPRILSAAMLRPALVHHITARAANHPTAFWVLASHLEPLV
ncbi:hypothetical protein B0H14DRAFT_3439741 [Mycena olivaceomarginata]|nr:hypothetical protein B0H14DRAFT_3439741 [Mycena olivaceomarginata]